MDTRNLIRTGRTIPDVFPRLLISGCLLAACGPLASEGPADDDPSRLDVTSKRQALTGTDGGAATPQLRAYMKEDGLQEANCSKPRIYIENVGTVPVSDFVWYFEFTTEAGKVPVLERWYPPDSTAIALESLGSGNYRVKFDFRVTLAPGQRLPVSDGYGIGLHYADWSAWDKSNDWSGQASNTFQLDDRILVADKDGNVIWGRGSVGTTTAIRSTVVVNDRGIGGVGTTLVLSPATVARETAKTEVRVFVDSPRFDRGGLQDPQMPYLTYYVLLPEGATTLSIQNATSTDTTTTNVRSTLEQELGRPVNFDARLNYQDRFYPAEMLRVDGIKITRGTRMALVRVSPFQYNPIQDVLVVHENIQATYTFPGGTAFAVPTGAIGTVVNNMVVNPKTPATGIGFAARERGRMLIIAASSVQDAAEELALWKRQMGYQVTIEARPSWAASDISIYLASLPSTALPDYLMLLGDNPEVGSFRIWGDPWAAQSYYMSDFTFVARDPNQGPLFDTTADMSIARIAISSAPEALAAVRKIIEHEKQPPSAASYYDRVLTAANFQDTDYVDGYDTDVQNGYEDMRYTRTAWDIAQYLELSQGKTADYLYSADPSVDPRFWNSGPYGRGQALPANLLRSNGFGWNASSNNIVAALNAGRMLALYRDHGSVLGWSLPDFTQPDVARLTNSGLLPVVFSINCDSGMFWDANRQAQVTSLADVLLAHPTAGAAAVIAATHTTLSGGNESFAAGLINALWPNPGLRIWFPHILDSTLAIASRSPVAIDKLGPAMLQADLEAQLVWPTMQLDSYEIFGDPTMEVYTSTPPAIAATVPATIDVNAAAVVITGLNITDGLATLTSGNTITALAEIAGQASVSLPISKDLQSGSAILTITAKGRRPFVRTLPVSAANVPSLIDRMADYAGYGAFAFSGLQVQSVRDRASLPADVGCGVKIENGLVRPCTANVSGATDEINVAANLFVVAGGSARQATVFDLLNPTYDFQVGQAPAGLNVQQVTVSYSDLPRRFRYSSFRLPDAVSNRIAASATGPRILLTGLAPTSYTMSAQDYGEVLVANNGTLTIPSGTYYVKELYFGGPTSGTSAAVRFSITSGQPVVIYTSRFGVRNTPQIRIDGGDASHVLIYADQEADMQLASLSDFHGTIVAPNSIFSSNIRMHGQVVADGVVLYQPMEYIPFVGAVPPDARLTVTPQPAPRWGPLSASYTLSTAQAGATVQLRARSDWGPLTRTAPNAAGTNQVPNFYDWNYANLGNRVGPFTIELLVNGVVVGSAPLLFGAQ